MSKSKNEFLRLKIKRAIDVVVGHFNMIKRFFFLLFRPDLLLNDSVKHSPHADRTQLRQSVSILRNRVVRAYMVVQVSIIITLSIHVAFIYLNVRIDHSGLILMRCAGYIFILWGIFSSVGWPIRTWKGETLPEIVDEEWHRFTYLVGLSLLLLSYLSEWRLYN